MSPWIYLALFPCLVLLSLVMLRPWVQERRRLRQARAALERKAREFLAEVERRRNDSL